MSRMNNSVPPILFVIFNREEVALKSLQMIRAVQPSKLYIAGDGARPHVVSDNEKVTRTRNAVLDSIDWDCDVKTLFQEDNLGCGPGVFSGIDWFFENEEMGIILEDDCVAQVSFFQFAEELLKKYKTDERIGLISGHNPIQSSFNDKSYCFSKYPCCWGWATWARAWKNMDFDMKWFDTEQKDSVLYNMGYKSKDVQYWKNRIKAIEDQKVSAWDWQWCYSVASQNQLTIFPSKNLVSNIGLGDDATHTTVNPLKVYNADGDVDFPLEHPDYILPNFEFDKRYYKDIDTLVSRIAWHTPKPIKDGIKRLIGAILSKK